MKLMKIMVAALVVAAMAAPAIASDLKLSGTMEVRGHYAGVDAELFGKYDDGSKYGEGTYEGSEAWNYQRLRTAGTYTVADGVSVVFQFDATEGNETGGTLAWGNSSNGKYTNRLATLQYDKAYLQLVKNGYTFQAGQLYSGRFGMTGALSDALNTGFMLKKDGLTLFHGKQKEQASAGQASSCSSAPYCFPGEDITKSDVSMTGAYYTYSTDNFTIIPQVAYSNTAGTEMDIFGAGVYAKTTLGAVSVQGEITMFDGEDAAGTGDLVGLQGILDVSAGVTDTVTVGGMFLYGQGTDDANETQITALPDTGFGGFSPFQFGFHATDFTYDITEFEVLPNAGMVAGQLYTLINLSEDLSLQAALGYVTEEESNVADVEILVLNAGIQYKLMANTTLKASVNYADYDMEFADVIWDDYDSLLLEGDALQGIMGVYVSF